MTDPHQVAERIVAESGCVAFGGKMAQPLVDAIAAALTEAGDGWKPEPFANCVERVYADLLVRHMNAARNNFNGPERNRAFVRVESLREAYPAETAAWEAKTTRLPNPPLPETRTP